ncbi:hypothetical protein [Halorhabdus sp. CUG00001]|uniref:hypothetical protein n=1 Tax=Halorhabdus sp. CUG00001 TaxID=2600297 RepID=UPI00131AA136|nr:hypothetical protein [Halorhabdus sp. CUG00001]
MVTPPHGDERSGGFLQNQERQYLAQTVASKAYAADWESVEPLSPEQQRKARHRIKREVATVEGMRKVLHDYTTDLNALVLFMIRSEHTDWVKFANGSVESVEPELCHLKSAIENLIEVANDHEVSPGKEELDKATNTLYPNADRATDGFAHEGEDLSFMDRFEERNRRQDALLTLVEKQGFAKVLDWVEDSDGSDIPNHRIQSGQTWGSVAYELSQKGVLEENENGGYELTSRGEDVHTTYERLLETGRVKTELNVGTDVTPREAVESAMKAEFDLEGDLPHRF